MPEVKASPRRGFLLCRRAVRAGLASGVLLFAAYSIGLAAEDPLGAPAPDRVEAEPNEESEAEPGPRYKDGIYLLDGGFYTSFAENSWRILSGPFHYDRDEWITVGIVLSVTGALMLLDDEIDDFWQDDVRGNTTDSIEDVVEKFGDSDKLLFGTLAGYALSEAVGLEREKAMFLNGFQSVALTGALIAGIKYLGQRERPDDADDAFDWNGPGGGEFNTAFPSGHSGNAFAMATVVAETYGEDHPWVPWLAYPLAGMTALGRVNAQRHWASDVFMGAAIGHFIGRMVTRHSPFLEEAGVEILPFGQQGATGLTLALRF
ncbi:MAG: phosphatase PAP2 family protein [Rhodospirillales bacterium]|nr:phosphatase PAP2 family protein [Rhodospirillales bacterium]